MIAKTQRVKQMPPGDEIHRKSSLTARGRSRPANAICTEDGCFGAALG